MLARPDCSAFLSSHRVLDLVVQVAAMAEADRPGFRQSWAECTKIAQEALGNNNLGCAEVGQFLEALQVSDHISGVSLLSLSLSLSLH